MEWIPITDKMPEENQWAFFYFGLQKPMVGIYKTNTFLCIEDGEFWSVKNDEITHWMPLPEPPKVAA